MPQAKAGLRESGTYDRFSRIYDAIFAPIEAPLTETAMEMLDAQPGERILEIGSGTGRVLSRIGRRVGRRGTALGVDLSAQMLAVSARRLAAPAGPSSAKLVMGDGRALPLAGATCDAVLMSFTLELFEPQGEMQVLAECARVLRRSGRLVVGSLWRADKPGLAASLYELGHRMFPAVLDCRPIDLDGVLRDSGFEVRRSTTRTLAGIPVRTVVAAPPDF